MSRARSHRAGLAAVMLAGIALAGGCGGEAPSPRRQVELTGEIRLPSQAMRGGKVTVNLYHAWALEGELRHPLQLFESFAAAPGAFSHRFGYPQVEGEGLVVYAWVDLDGDAVLCTPAHRLDLAGLAEVQEFPADRVSVTLDLTEPCRGPDWFYPRAPGSGSGTPDRSTR